MRQNLSKEGHVINEEIKKKLPMKIDKKNEARKEDLKGKPRMKTLQ